MKMREEPKPYEQFYHFTGKRYQVLTTAIHSETKESYVVYQALYGDYAVYVRPLEMFLSEVDHKKYPDIKQKYRFTRIVGDRLTEEGYAVDNGDTNKMTVNQAETLDEVPFFFEQGESEEKQTSFFYSDVDLKEDNALGEPDQNKEDGFELHPLVVEFLDAYGVDEKLRILTGIHAIMTDQMLTTIAVSMDLEVYEGPLEERYDQIRYALLTKKKYEGTRLR